MNEPKKELVIADLNMQSLDEIAASLDPNADGGVVHELNNIYCALNENENGEHTMSVARAVIHVSESIDSK